MTEFLLDDPEVFESIVALDPRGSHGRHRGEWTEERILTLRGYIAQNLSGGEIGALMGLGRCAVLGKAFRLGLTVGGGKKVAAGKRAKSRNEGGAITQRLRKERERERRVKEKKPSWRTSLPREEIIEIVDLPSPCAVDILGLTDTTCRWPMGHPNEPHFAYCGREPVGGLPYCHSHAMRAYSAARPR